MRTSITKLLMLIAVLFVAQRAIAQDFEVDGIYYSILRAGVYLINVCGSVCKVVL